MNIYLQTTKTKVISRPAWGIFELFFSENIQWLIRKWREFMRGRKRAFIDKSNINHVGWTTEG